MNEIEKQVVGNLLQKSEYIKKALDRNVTDDYFQFPETQALFKCILYYEKTYKIKLESDALQALLKASKIPLEMHPRILVLFEEVNTAQVASNFDLVIDEFAEYYKQTLLRQQLNRTVERLSNKEPAVEIIKAQWNDLLNLQRKVLPPNPTSAYLSQDMDDLVAEYFDRKAHPEKYKGVPIGFPDFDLKVGGQMPGTVMIIMGAPKTGKSVLMVNIARNVLLQGKRVYYHVNEGGKSLVEQRFVSCDAEIPYSQIRFTKLTPENEEKFRLHCAMLKSNPNFYIDSVVPSQSNVAYIDKKLRDEPKFDLVIIDYMGLMSASEKVEQDWLKWGVISQELKELAAMHQVPIITLMHVNPEGLKNKKSQSFGLEHMGLTKEPEKHVDFVASWKLEDPELFKHTHTGTAYISVQAARDAEACDVAVHIDTNMMKIQQLQVKIGH
jgi:replicative DNA helicase